MFCVSKVVVVRLVLVRLVCRWGRRLGCVRLCYRLVFRPTLCRVVTLRMVGRLRPLRVPVRVPCRRRRRLLVIALRLNLVCGRTRLKVRLAPRLLLLCRLRRVWRRTNCRGLARAVCRRRLLCIVFGNSWRALVVLFNRLVLVCRRLARGVARWRLAWWVVVTIRLNCRRRTLCLSLVMLLIWLVMMFLLWLIISLFRKMSLTWCRSRANGRRRTIMLTGVQCVRLRKNRRLVNCRHRMCRKTRVRHGRMLLLITLLVVNRLVVTKRWGY